MQLLTSFEKFIAVDYPLIGMFLISSPVFLSAAYIYFGRIGKLPRIEDYKN
ncbi:MAG: hypothetical protein LW817_04810 [Candidatus Caenarcaniphilales bacterium]|jgi:hypothetical protein|nr:hypothetical protein [Candidatus Caenarcaniphilales bacterium]